MEEKITFEQKLINLGNLTRSLESGNLTLDESLKIYTDAVKLIKECSVELEEAKRKVTMVVESNGQTEEKPFDEKL